MTKPPVRKLPERCARRLDHARSCGRCTSRARTGSSAMVRVASIKCSSSNATEEKRPWNRCPARTRIDEPCVLAVRLAVGADRVGPAQPAREISGVNAPHVPIQP